MTGNGKWWNTRVGRQWWQESWLFSTTLWALEDWKMEGGWMQAAKVSNDPSFSRARPIFHNLPNLPLLHILSNLTSPSHPSPHFPIRSNENILQLIWKALSFGCNRGSVNPKVLLILPKKESLLHQDAFQLPLSVTEYTILCELLLWKPCARISLFQNQVLHQIKQTLFSKLHPNSPSASRNICFA